MSPGGQPDEVAAAVEAYAALVGRWYDEVLALCAEIRDAGCDTAAADHPMPTQRGFE